MTKDETAVMLGMMREIYGKQTDSANPDMLIAIWHKYLGDEPYEIVQAAFAEHVAKSVYAPKPAEILDLVERAKWALFEETLYIDPFSDEELTDGQSIRKQIPSEYMPRGVSHKPKQYQIASEQRLSQSIKQLADKLRIEE